VVVMLVNDPQANSRAVKEAEDALIRWVFHGEVSPGRPNPPGRE
jgi:hypothetical protein